MTQQKKEDFGLYIHWPYCLSKCPYCDFASSVAKKIDEDILLKGYLRDLIVFKEKFHIQNEISSIFFGGGTPSLMSEKLFDSLINEISKNFNLSQKAEISLEANPDAITKEKMKNFAHIGLNRLSLGVQSLNEKDLLFLGRKHSLKTALQRIDEAKNIFNRINIDLIYARPKQSLKSWEKELTAALSLGLKHYSLYQLTLEEGTVFYKNNIPQISETQAIRLYLLTQEIMQNANLPAYEISNHASKNEECKHNLIYWMGNDYIGIGPAAHGRIGLTATQNYKNIQNWLSDGLIFTPLTKKERDEEKLLMGLRLIHEGYPIKNISLKKIEVAVKNKWIEVKNNKIFTTLKGRLLLNKLILLLSSD